MRFGAVGITAHLLLAVIITDEKEVGLVNNQSQPPLLLIQFFAALPKDYQRRGRRARRVGIALLLTYPLYR